MVYKRFRIVVLTRVLLLSGTLYLFFYLLFNAEQRLYATIFIVFLMIIYQTYALIHYVEKTNRDLNRFLLTIKHEDFSQTFIGHGLGSSFDDLKSAFNSVIEKFHKARSEKEEHSRYLQTVVQHVGIGLIAFRSDGAVELLNTAAKRLLRVPALRHISDLKSFSGDLVRLLSKIEPGQQALIKVNDQNELLQLAIHATQFRMREQNFMLVSLQNIHGELEETEIEAWQKLIRVLTHEIMNSVTPISSLAATINDMIDSDVPDKKQLTSESREDIRGGLRTIQKRSEGLLRFVEAYRNLTRVPTPNFEIFRISELLERIITLMKPNFTGRRITTEIRVVPDDLELTADPELVEQILINIYKNAFEAINGQIAPKIVLSSEIDTRGRIIIQVTDNGPGIPQDVQDKIFIPFFTTKNSGSGIGLSLSQQIMRLHGGTITVRSIPHESTVFTLRF